MTKTIVLIDLDASKFGNLALMKLSTWHRHHDYDVILLSWPAPMPILTDATYASCVFAKNASRAAELRAIPNASIGGSGIDFTTVLPFEIEHILPDYDLYDLDYSMGFTSRGCNRNCEFCIVPKKEGRIQEWADWREFLDHRHSKIKLLDNNLLMAPNHLQTLKSLAKAPIRVDINQGLDIRLMTDEIAYLLSRCKTWIGSFEAAGLRFAFDSPNLEKQVRSGVKLLTKYISKGILYFYVLVGFDTTFEEDTLRFRILKELGVCAYPMFYEDAQGKSHLPAHAPQGIRVTERDLPRGPRGGINKYVRLVNA